MSLLSQLFALQEIDTQLIQGQSRLHEIQKEMAEPQEISSLRAKESGLSEKIEETRVKVKDIELQIGSVQEKYSNSVDVLYSGTVNNPKELEDLQAEVDGLIKRKETLDESLLFQMEILESYTKEKEELSNQIETMVNDRTELIRELKEEQIALATDLKKVMETRKLKTADIDKKALEKYTKILRRNAGIGVVKIRNTNCLGCNVSIPNTMVNRVKRAEMLECPNCGRIMYHP